jgi:hypothetical protein
MKQPTGTTAHSAQKAASPDYAHTEILMIQDVFYGTNCSDILYMERYTH